MLAPQSRLAIKPRPFEAISASELNVGRLLLVILGTALALRVLCAIFFSGMIDNEGAEYARLAENILLGKGYTGIAAEGAQLVFPPLFPLLVAAVSLITGDAEIAGRTVSIIFGSLLVLPVYGIAKRLFDEKIGLGAAALVAVHPYLVNFSTTVFCETTYLTLLFVAVLTTMTAADRPEARALAAAGLFYALAYLVRPEAVAFLLIGAGFFILQRALANHGLLRLPIRELRMAALMVACFALVAGPYIAWLTYQTGGFRLQTKSVFNMQTQSRIEQGATSYAASFAVGPDLVAQGVWNRPNIDIVTESRLGVGDYAKSFAKRAKTLLRDIARTIAGSLDFGFPALFALAVLGLFGRPWPPRVAVDQLHLSALLALTMVSQFFIYYWDLRFYLMFPIVFCIWGAAGLPPLREWARQTARAWTHSERAEMRGARFAAAIALAAVLVPAAMCALGNVMWTRGSRPIENLSVTLGADSTGLRIADVETPFAFHAHAEFLALPYSDEATALKYLAQKKATHVVLRSEAQTVTPYLSSWMQNGVPGADMVGEATTTRGDVVRVYQLKSAAP